MIAYMDDRILTTDTMRALVFLYIGSCKVNLDTDYLLSPILAPTSLLARFPKTYIITGERDPMVDDTIIFSHRLRQAKLEQFAEQQGLNLDTARRKFNDLAHVEVSLLRGTSHGFLQMPGFFPQAWEYNFLMAEWVGELLTVAERRREFMARDGLSGVGVCRQNGTSRSPDVLAGQSLGEGDSPKIELMPISGTDKLHRCQKHTADLVNENELLSRRMKFVAGRLIRRLEEVR